jgi:alkylation response protein AidB-like acyl-CoA dehydrogenase
MDLTLSADELAFRDELRAWLDANNPGVAPTDDYGFEWRRTWQRKLHEGGWAGVWWPTEYGGRGASLIEQAIFSEELTRRRLPMPVNVLGIMLAGPTLMVHGSEEQKQRLLEPILSADEIWCQGFSEPEAGSDLASLKTRAIKRDGGWVVTGQKVWTTLAHVAKWCMLVARTEVRRLTGYRGLSKQQHTGVPGPEGSLPKWMSAETNQAISELAAEVLGADALQLDSAWAYRVQRSRGNSIEGGTTEILKNIIAERVLGLPRMKAGASS